MSFCPKPLIFLCLILLPFLSKSQNENDVLRYSLTELHGTARSTGMAGAFGALGADHSAIGSNPAGIALFRQNEVTFTPTFGGSNTEASFQGFNNSESKFNLKVDEFGLSFITMLDKEPNWKSFHFGISYHKLRSFEERIKIRAQSAERSLLDYFVREANGIPLSQLPQRAAFSGEMAYQAYLMDPLADSSSYSHELEGAEIDQEKEIIRSGGMNEVRFNFGIDRSNLLYLGATIGIPTVNFERTTIHHENVNSGSDVKDLEYREELSVNGTGLNAQLGAIVRPSESFRFGLAYKTPSMLSMSDEWATLLTAEHNDAHNGRSSFDIGPKTGEHSYRIRTPSRITASAAYFFGKLGLLSAEYRYRDPSNGRLKPSRENKDDGYQYNLENIFVKDRFTLAHEIRIGTEWRFFHPILIRGGFRYRTASVQGMGGKNVGPVQDFTLGMGYREDGYFVDFSFQNGWSSELHRPTDPDEGRVARIEKSRWAVRITGGMRF